ncbi:lysine-specific demethylase [Pycnococcus provasolii]
MHSPSASLSPLWTIVPLSSGSGDIYAFDDNSEKSTLQMGRAPDCDIRIESQAVSRKHALISKKNDGTLWVTAQSLANPLIVNGTALKPNEPLELQDGYTIEVRLEDDKSRKFEVKLPKTTIEEQDDEDCTVCLPVKSLMQQAAKSPAKLPAKSPAKSPRRRVVLGDASNTADAANPAVPKPPPPPTSTRALAMPDFGSELRARVEKRKQAPAPLMSPRAKRAANPPPPVQTNAVPGPGFVPDAAALLAARQGLRQKVDQEEKVASAAKSPGRRTSLFRHLQQGMALKFQAATNQDEEEEVEQMRVATPASRRRSSRRLSRPLSARGGGLKAVTPRDEQASAKKSVQVEQALQDLVDQEEQLDEPVVEAMAAASTKKPKRGVTFAMSTEEEQADDGIDSTPPMAAEAARSVVARVATPAAFFAAANATPESSRQNATSDAATPSPTFVTPGGTRCPQDEAGQTRAGAVAAALDAAADTIVSKAPGAAGGGRQVPAIYCDEDVDQMGDEDDEMEGNAPTPAVYSAGRQQRNEARRIVFEPPPPAAPVSETPAPPQNQHIHFTSPYEEAAPQPSIGPACAEGEPHVAVEAAPSEGPACADGAPVGFDEDAADRDTTCGVLERPLSARAQRAMQYVKRMQTVSRDHGLSADATLMEMQRELSRAHRMAQTLSAESRALKALVEHERARRVAAEEEMERLASEQAAQAAIVADEDQAMEEADAEVEDEDADLQDEAEDEAEAAAAAAVEAEAAAAAEAEAQRIKAQEEEEARLQAEAEAAAAAAAAAAADAAADAAAADAAAEAEAQRIKAQEEEEARLQAEAAATAAAEAEAAATAAAEAEAQRIKAQEEEEVRLQAEAEAAAATAAAEAEAAAAAADAAAEAEAQRIKAQEEEEEARLQAEAEAAAAAAAAAEAEAAAAAAAAAEAEAAAAAAAEAEAQRIKVQEEEEEVRLQAEAEAAAAAAPAVEMETEEEEAVEMETEEDIACVICGSADDGDVLLLCDGCDKAYHKKCAGVRRVPKGDWFCSTCKEQKCSTCKEPKKAAPAPTPEPTRRSTRSRK